jgi:nucleoid-associated protein YgaU
MAKDPSQPSGNVYGEGNYKASREYNEKTRKFAQSGKVEQAARDAAPQSDADALQMAAAEAEGKRHAKGEDPALTRKKPAPADAPESPMPGKD